MGGGEGYGGEGKEGIRTRSKGTVMMVVKVTVVKRGMIMVMITSRKMMITIQSG